MTSLVGRFFITSQCSGFEFVPASTSARYKCEMIKTFISLEVATAVANSDYMSIESWHWLTGGSEHVLIVDASSVSFKSPATDRTADPLALPADSTARKQSGQISHVSTFLRLKDSNDPFSDSFCVHLTNGDIFVLRGKKFFALLRK